MRGPFLQFLTECPDFAGECVGVHRDRDSSQDPFRGPRQADEKLKPVRQNDWIDNDGGSRQHLKARGSGPGGIHTFVAEVIPEFSHLKRFDHLPCFHQIRLILLGLRNGRRLLQQKVCQLKEYRSDRFAKGGLRHRECRRSFRTDGLKCIDGPAVGGDRLLRFSLHLQQAPGLPMPAVQRLRRYRLLGREHRAARDVQGLVIPAFSFIDASQIAQGIG